MRLFDIGDRRLKRCVAHVQRLTRQKLIGFESTIFMKSPSSGTCPGRGPNRRVPQNRQRSTSREKPKFTARLGQIRAGESSTRLVVSKSFVKMKSVVVQDGNVGRVAAIGLAKLLLLRKVVDEDHSQNLAGIDCWRLFL
jgi:hypothetical protein